MTRGSRSWLSPVASLRPSGSDAVIQGMLKRGVPITRENYIEAAYPEGKPSPWTAEHEDALPLRLQNMRWED